MLGRRGRGLGERGTTAVEFAVVGSLLFSILLGAMDLANYWYSIEAVRTYASETMRAALVAVAMDGTPGVNTCSNGGTPVTVTNPRTPGLDPAKLNLTSVICQRNPDPNNAAVTASRTVRITVSYAYSFTVARIFGFSNQTLTETQEMTF